MGKTSSRGGRAGTEWEWLVFLGSGSGGGVGGKGWPARGMATKGVEDGWLDDWGGLKGW